MWFWRTLAWLCEPKLSYIYAITLLFTTIAALNGMWLPAIGGWVVGWFIELTLGHTARSKAKEASRGS